MTDRLDLPALVRRVCEYIEEETLWEHGASLLVAVSGGPDSVALLDMLHTAGQHVAVAHINHRLRAEAEEDATFVAALAIKYAVSYQYRCVDVPARVAESGESVEEAARELRYAALQEMAREARAAYIVTGHTADDQAETVLMRVLRGAGPAGLAGIPPKRGNIVRPLLRVWRTDIMAYLQQRGLAYRTDLSNYSTDFLRNRVRLELLPQLEGDYAPRLSARLQHLAELARQDDVVLSAQADEHYARLRQPLPDGVALPMTPELPRAIRWRLWRRAIGEVRGGLEDIGYDHLEDIQRLPPGLQVHLPGVRVLYEANRLVFLPALVDAESTIFIADALLPVPGTHCLPEADCCLLLETFNDRLPIECGDVAVLDADAVRGALRVRSWQPGDRFRPLGAPGERKLQDIFVDAGVPRRLRTRVPVILDEEGIVWLAGFRIADRVKMEPVTVRSLRISIEWELNPWTLKLSNAG